MSLTLLVNLPRRRLVLSSYYRLKSFLVRSVSQLYPCFYPSSLYQSTLDVFSITIEPGVFFTTLLRSNTTLLRSNTYTKTCFNGVTNTKYSVTFLSSQLRYNKNTKQTKLNQVRSICRFFMGLMILSLHQLKYFLL